MLLSHLSGFTSWFLRKRGTRNYAGTWDFQQGQMFSFGIFDPRFASFAAVKNTKTKHVPYAPYDAPSAQTGGLLLPVIVRGRETLPLRLH